MKKSLGLGNVWVWCGFLGFGLLSQPLQAETSVEVVQSVPIETQLDVPGVRQTQEVWLELIQSAQSTIDLEEFYVFGQKGEALTPVLDSLVSAASRGVKVRLLLDSKFYKNYSHDPLELSKVAGIEVGVLDMGSGVQHAKYFVVDQSRAYVGSANFDWLALRHIHEVGLFIADPAVASDLQKVFNEDWRQRTGLRNHSILRNPHSSDPSRVLNGSMSLQVLASPPVRAPGGVANTLPVLTELMGMAKQILRIQVYQYTTKAGKADGRFKDLDNAIRAAANRGVQVQLMVDAVALKTGQTDLKALSQLQNVEVRKVVIPEWSGGHLDYARLVHSKYLTVDSGIAWVGSENWSENYFSQSRNVGVKVQSAEVVSQLNQVFMRLWNSAYATRL